MTRTQGRLDRMQAERCTSASRAGRPAGVLAWVVGGAVIGGVAGHYLGRPISKGDLKEIGDAMSPALATTTLTMGMTSLAPRARRAWAKLKSAAVAAELILSHTKN